MAWNDVLGQELAKRVFKEHLASARVPNAYLLAGPEGIGKRRLALEMAKALVCERRGVEPCGECRACGQADRVTHPDVHLIGAQEGSGLIRIEEIRHVVGRLALKPYSAPFQVAVIKGADRLTEEAANSLLKSLEEPGASAKFLLTTARPQHCLPTILSRCQMIRCQGLASALIAQALVESKAVDAQAAGVISRLSGGSVSRATDLAARWAQHRQFLDRLAEGQAEAWLSQPLPESRQDVAQLIDGMVGWLRDVAVAAADAGEAVHAGYEAPLAETARRVDLDRCLETAFELVILRESIEQFVNPKLVASLAREKWLALTVDA